MFPSPGVGEGAKGDHFFFRASTKGVVSRKEASQHTPRLSQDQATSNRSRYFVHKDHQFLGAWEQITNDTEILEIIEGYSIKFQQTPFQVRPPPPLRNLSDREMAAIDKEMVDPDSVKTRQRATDQDILFTRTINF